MLRSMSVDAVMLVLSLAVAGAVTPLLARRFAWSLRLRDAVAALLGVACWFTWMYTRKAFLGAEPFAWLSQSLSPGWVQFIQEMALCVPLGFAPVLADIIMKARSGRAHTAR